MLFVLYCRNYIDVKNVSSPWISACSKPPNGGGIGIFEIMFYDLFRSDSIRCTWRVPTPSLSISFAGKLLSVSLISGRLFFRNIIYLRVRCVHMRLIIRTSSPIEFVIYPSSSSHQPIGETIITFVEHTPLYEKINKRSVWWLITLLIILVHAINDSKTTAIAKSKTRTEISISFIRAEHFQTMRDDKRNGNKRKKWQRLHFMMKKKKHIRMAVLSEDVDTVKTTKMKNR